MKLNLLVPKINLSEKPLKLTGLYLFLFYLVQVLNMEQWLDSVKWYNHLAQVTSFSYLQYHSNLIVIPLLSSLLLLFSSNKLFVFLNLFNWLSFLNLTPVYYTPQEEYISIILLTYLLTSDGKINTLWKESLFAVFGISLAFSAYYKFISPSWQDGFAMVSILTTPLSYPYLLSFLPFVENLVLASKANLMVPITQFLVLLILIPSKRLRKLILLFSYIFFGIIILVLSLPSVIAGMFLFIYLLYKLNEEAN
jgi:hypothetical protein